MTDLEWIDGLYVGQLDEREMQVFERAVKFGEAYRSYEGGMGFMGCAKVKLGSKVVSPSHSEGQ